MLRKISLLILICSLFSVFACNSLNSALKEGDGDTDEVTKYGTPIELPLPAPSGLKAIMEKFIKDNPRWEGNYIEDGNETTRIAYLQFDTEEMTISVVSSLNKEFRSFSFEVLEDGSVKMAEDKIKISFDADMETMAVVDNDVDHSLNMHTTDEFEWCGASLSMTCQALMLTKYDTVAMSVKETGTDAIHINAQMIGVIRSDWLAGSSGGFTARDNTYEADCSHDCLRH